MDNLKDQIKKVLEQIPIDFGGGCSFCKSLIMAGIIKQFDIKTSIDIGVYRGRSLFPQAVAHLNYTDGIVYGVDPWSNEAARQYDNIKLQKQIDEFIDSTDYEIIFNEVENIRNKNNFEQNCKLVRATSVDAYSFFLNSKISFGLIHIDGNHDEAQVTKDVDLYTELLDKNSFIILDDISWDSIRPVFQKLDSQMKLMYKLQDNFNDFAIFWNGKSQIKYLTTKYILSRICNYAEQ